MRLGILSMEPKNYSTQRLKEAAKKRGFHVDILNTMKCFIYVEQGNPNLFYKNEPVKQYDAIIPRIGSSITFFGCSVVRQLEQMGVFSLNSAISIATSRDKLRATQILCKHKIGMPVTAFARHKSCIVPAIQQIKSKSVVIKLLEGTQGVGVILADTQKVAEAIIETLQSTKQNVLIQRFVKESKGCDIRAFVVGGKVVAAMRRTAKEGEFRSNVHRGGSVEKVVLDAEFEKTAIRAAQILGLNVAGVDMLEGKNGPQLMEVNSSPGLEGIERATGVDVAGEIIDYMQRLLKFPDLDIRQRLTLSTGYGVAEVKVHAKSDMVNKKIQDTNLRHNDILVLSLTRGDTTIPNPKGSRVIESNDILLCFGNLDAIQKLIPEKPSKLKGRTFHRGPKVG